MSVKAIEVAAAVIVHKNKVLLARRSGGLLNNLWEFPGGKFEKDETAAHAARRELFEELEINIVAGKTLLELQHQYPDKKVNLHFVACRLDNNPELYLKITEQNPLVDWFIPGDFPFSEFCPADKIAARQLPWTKILNARKINE
jgi:mutator protein MutT